MKHEKAKDVAFVAGAVCYMALIGAVILGIFVTTERFVTQYSILANRSGNVRGR